MRSVLHYSTIIGLIGLTGLLTLGLNSAYAQNLLKNGGFEDGAPDPWTTYGNVEMKVVDKGATEGRYALQVTVKAKGANFWDSGLQNAGHTFKKDKKYTLAAFLRSDNKLQINFKPELGKDPWTGYGEKSFTMTDKWQEYYTTTAVIAADVNPATITFHIAYEAGQFFIDGVRFIEGDYVPPPAPPATSVQPKEKLAISWGQLKALKAKN